MATDDDIHGVPKPAKADFRYFFKQRIYYHEIDAQSVVYNGHYLRFFDVAVAGYFRSLGFDLAAMPQGQDFHVAHADVNFHRPIRLDDEIATGVKIERIGTSSLTFSLAIFGAERNTLHASGAVVWVWSDLEKGRSVALPQALRQLFQQT